MARADRPATNGVGGARPSTAACWRNRTDAIPERDPAVPGLHRPHLAWRFGMYLLSAWFRWQPASTPIQYGNITIY